LLGISDNDIQKSMTKLWQHMAATHCLHLLESEKNDIRWAANEDAEQARIKLINEMTQWREIANLLAENGGGLGRYDALKYSDAIDKYKRMAAI